MQLHDLKYFCTYFHNNMVIKKIIMIHNDDFEIGKKSGILVIYHKRGLGRERLHGGISTVVSECIIKHFTCNQSTAILALAQQVQLDRLQMAQISFFFLSERMAREVSCKYGDNFKVSVRCSY